MIPASASGFANTHSGIPEGGEQHMVTLIRHRREGHSLPGPAGRCGPRGSGHSSQESAVAKSTPGAMGNRETRSGEFCRGMTLFMSYFHVAHALFMDTGILT